MRIEKATYNVVGGGEVTVEYDADAPCRGCGLPVVSASMAGTNVCPWCDMGKHRDGTPMSLKELMKS